MLIRMTTSIVGAGFDLHPGDETERFPDAEAMRMIVAGYAVAFADAPVERAVLDPVMETRAPQGKRRGRPRKER